MRKHPKAFSVAGFMKKFVAGAFVAELACVGAAYLFYRRTNRNPGKLG
jgi:hypothetical protein